MSTETTTKRTVPAIYMTGGGRVTCADHGGTYLAYAIKADPKAREYNTPLDHIDVIVAADPEAGDFKGFGCEDCGAELEQI